MALRYRGLREPLRGRGSMEDTVHLMARTDSPARRDPAGADVVSEEIPPWLGRARHRRLAAAAALIVPVLAYASPYLFSDRCVSGGDFAAYERVHVLWNREAFQKDRAALLWTPHAFGGTAEFGRFQGAEPLLYPPHWLWLVIPSPDQAYEILFTLHILLAAGGMYRLARELGGGRVAAVISGLSYALSFMTPARMVAGHYGPFVTMAQAPLLLALLLRLLKKPGAGHLAALAGALAMAIVSGQPAYLYHLSLAGLALGAWQLWRLHPEGGRWMPRASWVAGAAVLAVLLAAVFLLPAFEIAFHSTRPPGRNVYGEAAVPRHHAFVLENAITFFVPFFGGTGEAALRMSRDYWHEKSVYIGILPLLCAGLALGWARRPGIRMLVALGFAALMDAMARDLPFHSLLCQVLPGYGAFRVPGRAVWIAVLCLSLLAGIGWERLRGCRLPRRPLLIAAGATLGAVAGFSALVLQAPAEAAGLASFGTLALLLMGLASRRPTAASAGAVILVAANLLAVGIPRQPLVDPASVAPASWYEAQLGNDRDAFRILNLIDYDLPAAGRGCRLLRGYGYPVPSGTAAYYARAWKDAPPFSPDSLGVAREIQDPGILDRLNVKWIVAVRQLVPTWRELARRGDAIIFENPEAFPAAFLLEGGPAEIERRINNIRVRCSAAGPARLVVSESWMPGWTATVEGVTAPVAAYEGALLQVEVPAGASRVEFSYLPPLLPLGAWISGSTLAALFAGLGIVRWRARRTAPSA